MLKKMNELLKRNVAEIKKQTWLKKNKTIFFSVLSSFFLYVKFWSRHDLDALVLATAWSGSARSSLQHR